MKVLVCTAGSEQSLKAAQKAALIAKSPDVEDVAIIHVYSSEQETSPFFITSEKQDELVRKVKEDYREERKKILDEALAFFKDNNTVRTILKEGHPSHTIVTVAAEEGFDLIVIGSRGLGGLEKLFLGSVSNAVLHEVKDCSVVIVK